MTGFLRSIHAGIDATNEFVGKLFACCLPLAILVSVANALSRKFLYWSSNSLLELQWYLFGATFMLGAAWTLRNDKHVRIDAISTHLKLEARRLVELAGFLLIVLPFTCAIFYLSVPYLIDSIQSGERSNSVGGLIVWPAKALITIGFLLLILQIFAEIIKIVIGDRTFLPEDHPASEPREGGKL